MYSPTGFFRPQTHPTEGELEALDTGCRLDRQVLPLREHQPNLGEHGREILSQLGYLDTEIDNILESGDAT